MFAAFKAMAASSERKRRDMAPRESGPHGAFGRRWEEAGGLHKFTVENPGSPTPVIYMYVYHFCVYMCIIIQ